MIRSRMRLRVMHGRRTGGPRRGHWLRRPYGWSRPCCCCNSTDPGHNRVDHRPVCGSLDSYGVPCTCPSFDLLTDDD